MCTVVRIASSLLSLACALAATAPASAQATLLTQNRSVSATASSLFQARFEENTDSQTAAGFANFNGYVAEEASISTYSESRALQSSSLSSSEIVAFGEAMALGTNDCVGGVAWAEATSSFSTTFSVAGPTPYELTGFVIRAGSPDASYHLTGPNGFGIHVVGSGSLPVPGLHSGTLAAGTYTLTATAASIGTQADAVDLDRTAFALRLKLGAQPAATPATASLTTQARSVEWSETYCNFFGECDTPSDAAFALSFGLFDATAGSARQVSNIGTSLMSATGSVAPSVAAIVEANESDDETASSAFSVTFSVAEPTKARLRAALMGPTTLTFAALGAPISTNEFTAFDQTVILAPGSHTLSVSAQSSLQTPFCLDFAKDYRAFGLSLALLEHLATDLNFDGLVNGADLAILLGAWGTSGPGDVNGSGVVDGADLAFLLGDWTN